MEPVRSIGLSSLIPLGMAALTHCNSLDKVFASFDETLVTKITTLFGSLGLS
jgi:hypothetical protein